jgi:hypothetical protein
MATATGRRQRLQNIDAYEFESFVAELWNTRGWETEVSQATSDMGVDIIARKSDGLVNQTHVIQAKRYSEGNKVTRPNVQQYYSLRDQESADGVVVVTTSSFTSQAEEWAEEHNIKLIDGDDLLEILDENDQWALLDDYAPTLSEVVEPRSDVSPASATDGVRQTNLPDAIAEPAEFGKAAFAAGIIASLVLVSSMGPEGSGLMVAGIVAAGGLYVMINPTDVMMKTGLAWKEFYQYPNGGSVVEEQGEIIYRNGSTERTFDTRSSTEQNLQQALAYGELVDRFGEFKETDKGTLPTQIATADEDTILAYRFAVHDETPEEVADEMNSDQKSVVNSLSKFIPA